MAKVNIFISSTCYDLSQIRDDLKQSIIDLGHNPILSEQKDFPIDPNLSNAENCINAINKEADILILIIGNKYGSVLETGKSITNTEFLTAINKGIPVYTFALKQMTALLPLWEKNKDANFSNIVDDNRVFEFLSDVRKKRGLWNFEFEKAQDIIDIIKAQLSNLFRDALTSKLLIESIGKSDLYLKVSSQALNILLKRTNGYEIKFFMQAMHDEICKYNGLKNDYVYSILVKSTNRISNFDQLTDWIQLKLGLLKNFIYSLNKLTDAYSVFAAPPGVKADLEGLYYVACSYARFYANLLEWGIEVRSTIVPDEYTNVVNAFAKFPKEAIRQIEEFPINSLKVIEEQLELANLNKQENKTITLCLNVSINDEDIQLYDKELAALANSLGLNTASDILIRA